MRQESVDFDGYVAFRPGVSGPWADLPREEARRVYEKVVAQRLERVAALEQLLSANGQSLGESNDAVRRLEAWFRAGVVPEKSEPERPAAVWLAVAFDIGIFLGELIIKRRPSLHWGFYTRHKRAGAYQRPVIMGFEDAAQAIDPVRRVASVAFRVVGGWLEEPDEFLHLLWSVKASENWSPLKENLPFVELPLTPTDRQRLDDEALRALENAVQPGEVPHQSRD